MGIKLQETAKDARWCLAEHVPARNAFSLSALGDTGDRVGRVLVRILDLQTLRLMGVGKSVYPQPKVSPAGIEPAFTV